MGKWDEYNMENTWVLPDEYRPIQTIVLQKNRKTAILVNLFSVLLAAAMIVPALFAVPFNLFHMEDGRMAVYFARLIVLIAALLAYLVLHELVHGVFIWFFSGRMARFGFTGLYAYAGSEAYFKKSSYLIIALAPIVVWGAVLLLLNFLVPPDWFWVIYLLQAMNVSGAAGDLYVAVLFARLPKNILVQDSGVAMTVYAPKSR